jgi:t-SNARE complex subunit (syntaxin)
MMDAEHTPISDKTAQKTKRNRIIMCGAGLLVAIIIIVAVIVKVTTKAAPRPVYGTKMSLSVKDLMSSN